MCVCVCSTVTDVSYNDWFIYIVYNIVIFVSDMQFILHCYRSLDVLYVCHSMCCNILIMSHIIINNTKAISSFVIRYTFIYIYIFLSTRIFDTIS